MAEWRSVAAELGLGRAELEALAGRVVERPQPAGEELRELATELAGPRGLTRRASTFDRRSTVQAFCEAHAYGATRSARAVAAVRTPGGTDRPMTTGMPVESPVRGNVHAGFGGRVGETDQPKG